MGFWYHSKVLVTGANGFAGSNLCKQLVDKEAHVYALVRDDSNLFNLKEVLSKINIVYGDIRYRQTVDDAVIGKDIVFNLAAKVNIEETRKNPSETLRTNINGALNVAECSRKRDVKRLVHVSTCHIYGDTKEEDLPINEKTLPSPVDVYSISKYSAEMLVASVQKIGLDVITTRAFNHYGPGQTGDFFIAKVIKNILQGTQPTLGSGKPTRDYSYISDIVRGYILAAEKGRNGEVYHFASGKETSIEGMYHLICNVMGKNVPAIWQSARANDMSRSWGNYEKAKTELGWSPVTPIEEGLKSTVKWWQENKSLTA